MTGETGTGNKTLTWQQRVWKWVGDLVYRTRPLLPYLLLPPAIPAFGLFIAGLKEYIEFFLRRSDQFYRTLGLILVLYLMRRECRRWEVSIQGKTTLYWRGVNAEKLLLLMGAEAGFNLFTSVTLTVTPFPNFPTDPHHEMTYGVLGKVDKILAILSVIFPASLMEELTFRRYTLSRSLRRFESQMLAMLLCTGIFAACHVTPPWATYGFFMGLLLARVSIIEDNIIYAVVLHMGHNIMTLPVWFVNESQQISMVLSASPALIGVYGVIEISVVVPCLQQYPLDIRQLAEYFPRTKRKEEG